MEIVLNLGTQHFDKLSASYFDEASRQRVKSVAKLERHTLNSAAIF
jgi:hypothetical protein